MGGAGDPPAPVGGSPTGNAGRTAATRPSPLARTVVPCRPASRRTEQASRLCYPLGPSLDVGGSSAASFRSLAGRFEHFLDGRGSVQSPAQAVLEHGPHPFLAS